MRHIRGSLFCLLALVGLSAFTQQAVFAVGADVEAALQALVDRGEIPCVVSVMATPDKILQVDCVGYADLEAKTPVTAKSLFWMASTTKFISAVAAMSLVEEGKIDLDAPLEKYLPELARAKVAVKNPDGTTSLRAPASKPTVRQTLSHTTGWPFKTEYMQEHGNDSLSMQEHVKYVADCPMLADPGTRYQYSSLSIDLACAVIEVAAGKPFAEFLQERFFDPLGMHDTAFIPSKQALERLVNAYRWDGSQKKYVETSIYALRPPYDNPERHAEGGGGLFSTALDMARFGQMVANKGELDGRRYVSAASLDEMMVKQTGDGLPYYGLGSSHGHPWLGHRGAYGTNLMVCPETGQVQVFMIQVKGSPNKVAVQDAWNQALEQRWQELKPACSEADSAN